MRRVVGTTNGGIKVVEGTSSVDLSSDVTLGSATSTTAGVVNLVRTGTGAALQLRRLVDGTTAAASPAPVQAEAPAVKPTAAAKKRLAKALAEQGASQAPAAEALQWLTVTGAHLHNLQQVNVNPTRNPVN